MQFCVGDGFLLLIESIENYLTIPIFTQKYDCYFKLFND
jgi:hypothetical protein